MHWQWQDLLALSFGTPFQPTPSMNTSVGNITFLEPVTQTDTKNMISTSAKCSADFGLHNSVGVSPCLLAAEIMGACSGGHWHIPALPNGTHYLPPKNEPDGGSSGLCSCSWVYYNLLGACTACQNIGRGSIVSWTRYRSGCSPLHLSNIYFPKNISLHVLIPQWATLNRKSCKSYTSPSDNSKSFPLE
ncbi:hypothetical protein BDZ94DRAFT_639451 [Collybia nuda]|uniref:Uncharacterized protein n=1 Tax=Collybia nuda TaxID=64659 RepID=A0A9P5Y6E8_9AGAR|nr:hypothetical protein BDZ94DRAFT_639451 [Collybia nuda]